MTIQMKPFKVEELISKEGKYLVRTVSPVLNNVQHLQARCKIVWNDKKERYENSVDVNYQTVTHISTDIIV